MLKLLNYCASIAQLDRASDFGSEGCGFDSCWGRHKINNEITINKIETI